MRWMTWHALHAWPEPKARKNKEFDFSKYPQRHVALQVMYAGWDYRGFASQGDEGGVTTVEAHLFHALRTTRLIPPDATWQVGPSASCSTRHRHALCTHVSRVKRQPMTWRETSARP